ncbi:unnamed protein product [Ectocarpus sp. 8 AP-2014]
MLPKMAHTTPRISNLLQIVLYQQNVPPPYDTCCNAVPLATWIRSNARSAAQREGFCSGCLPPSW